MIGENQQDVIERQRRVEQKNSMLLRERERQARERRKQIWMGVVTLSCLLGVAIAIVILITQALRGK